MFLYLISLKLRMSEEAVLLTLCKITESRKEMLKVEILHNLREF